ncbi:MAG: hypothetical protein JSS60_04045 [Verrucomicrobia bacterium]|nr:hypothetical protein [Verrucomicrobiota bacterium]
MALAADSSAHVKPATEIVSKVDLRRSFNPSVRNGYEMWISGDLLCWLPREKSISFLNKGLDVFKTSDFTEANRVFPDFDWDFGYRLGIGHLFAEQKWDVSVNWTHYKAFSDQKKGSLEKTFVGMFPIWSIADDIIEGDYVSYGKMHWTLDLDLLDLKFSRDLPFGRFNLKPFVALTTGWVNQDFDITYTGGIFLSGFDIIEMKNNYWGMGPSIGFDPRFYLGAGWSLYGNAAMTMLIGSFDVHQKENYLFSERVDLHRHRNRLGWVSDLGVGILWKTLFMQQRYALSFKLGWEYLVLFHQNLLKQGEFHLVSHDRDLQIQGGTFSARFDF